MKTEIGGTFKWSDKAKAYAYAAAFREGDAVRVGGEWYEVKKREVTGANPGDVHATTTKVNSYNLNYRHDGDMYYEGVAKGFLGSRVDLPYEIVTPKDYEVRKGDKLVWLGDTNSSHSFGWMYSVFDSETGRLVYFNNKDNSRLADSERLGKGEWGVIPRYENVEEEEEMKAVAPIKYSGKFQAGDRVRVARIAEGINDETTYLKTGTVVSVESWDNRLPYCILADDYDYVGRKFWYNEAALELIESESVEEEKEEASEVSKKDEAGGVCPSKFLGKYNVGDKVVLSNEDVKAGDASSGARGVVLEVDENDEFCPYYVKFEGDDRNEGSDIIEWCNESELSPLELEKNVKEEEEMNGKDECVGKFKKGDRVRVTGGYYKGWEGSIDRSAKAGGEHSCSVSFGGRHGFRWVEEELLELVEESEKSPEQEAFEYLLTLDETAIKNFMTGEINDWAKELLEQKDYDSAKQAIEILEKLEKGE